MRRWWYLLILAIAGGAYAQTGPANYTCYQGGVPAKVQGIKSTNYLLGIVPGCKVEVFIHGTSAHATIYADSSNTFLSNPFTANALGSINPGGWIFWASVNQAYDVIMSGGIPPNNYVQPVPLTVQIGGGGGGGATVVEVNSTPISPASPANFVDTSTVTWQFIGGTIQATAATGSSGCEGTVPGDNSSTNCGYQNRVGDTANIPANVSTFGSTVATANSGDNVIAIGNNAQSGNPAPADRNGDVVAVGDNPAINNDVDQLIAIGDADATNATGSNTVTIGNNNLVGSTALDCGVQDTVLIGRSNQSPCAKEPIGFSNSDVIGIGDRNWGGLQDPNSNVFENVIVAGQQNFLTFGSTSATFHQAIGLGYTNLGAMTGASSELVAIGDTNVTGGNSSLFSTLLDVVGIGDANAEDVHTGSSDIVAIGNSNANGSADAPGAGVVNELVAIGSDSGEIGAGIDIVAIGVSALPGGITTPSTGNEIVAIGNNVLGCNTTGSDIVAIGDFAGSIGYVPGGGSPHCGNANLTGSHNVWIGDTAGPNTSSQLSNAIAIGYQAQNTSSNQTVIGNPLTTQAIIYGLGSTSVPNNPTSSPFTAYSLAAGNPVSVAIDGSGNVWVTTSTSLSKFNSSGTLLGTFAGGGQDVMVDSGGNIWTASNGPVGLYKYNSSGTILGTFNGSGCGSLVYLAHDSSNNIWATCNGSNHVAKFDSAGTFIASYAVGTTPIGLAIDGSDHVWVANYASNNVTELNNSGGLIGTFAAGGLPYSVAIDSSGNVWVGSNGNTITELNSSGSLLGTFTPGGDCENSIAIDASHNIWVANYCSNTVTELTSAGAITQTFAVGQQPEGLAIDGSGNVWVTNYGSGSIMKIASGSTGILPASGGTNVSSINSTPGAFTFSFSAGAGSCSGTTCTFTGSGSGGGSVTNFIASAGSWPSWLVPSVATSTTTPTLSVTAGGIPNAALVNTASTVNGQTCTLGSSCTVAAAAGTLTGTTLNSTVVNSSLTSVGTIATGLWHGTAIGGVYGGTGLDSSASTGVAQLTTGTWSFAALPLSKLATQAANTLVGALTATTPSALAVPDCHGALNGLTWTAGTGLGCNTFASGSNAFSALTSSTNTTAAMLVGTGSSLAPIGSGTITPSQVNLGATGNGGVGGNLQIANFNSGTGASSTTAWFGDGTWKTPGGGGTVTVVCSGTFALHTNPINSASFDLTTQNCTGLLTTDNIALDFNGDPTSTTGYIPSTSGMLTIIKYPTANTINVKVVNNTATNPLTPGAISVNYRVFR